MGWILSFLAALIPSVQHGTAVVTLASRDGFVMAADGLAIIEQPTNDPANPYIRTRQNAEPKIAVCDKVFLCGMSGVNPLYISDKGLKIEYDFQDWISTIRSTQQTSPRQFANAIQSKARRTF